MCMKCPLIFQFHKGAIETIITDSTSYVDVDFQFHKGAIETRQDSVLGVFDPCFNPRAHVERDKIILINLLVSSVSIHAPTWGATAYSVNV